MADNQYNARVIRLGIPDEVIEHGEQPELWQECGYDAKAIIEAVSSMAVVRTTKSLAS
jgi:1-deoxy-D-xylulose-5-phosphate synthase